MRKIFTKLLALSFFTLLFTNSIFATDVIWPFTSTTVLAPATTSGTGFTAANATFNSTSGLVAIKDYTGKDATGAACARISGTGSSATAMTTSYSSSNYIQYTLTATSGYNLDVSAIKLYLGGLSATVYAAIYYSLDGFTTSNALVPSSSYITLQANGSSPYVTTCSYSSTNFSGSTNIAVASGKTLTLRVYPWCNSTSTGKYIILSNTTITFTAALATTDPTIMKSSGTTPVTVMETYPLSSVVYNYANVSDDANVISEWYTDRTYTTTATAPTGVSLDKNTTAKTVTLSGTPALATAGKYFYKIRANETNGNSITDSIIITPYVTPTPTIALSSGSAIQGYKANNSITNIVYNLTNATGATCSTLPTGISGQFASTGTNTGTFTISGTLDAGLTPSVNDFTVTATPMAGYTGSDITATGKLIVKSATANNILYLATDATTISNDKFLEKLTISTDYIVTKRQPINPSSSVDYSNINLVVLHESLAGGDATTTTNEVSTIKSLDKPILNTKSFFYTYNSTASSNRWGWGTAYSVGSPKGIKVIQPNHPVFDGLNKAADSIYIYNTATWKNIQTASFDRIGGYNIANGSVGTTGVAIHDLPGSVRIGSGSTSKYLMISLFNGKYNDLTEDGLKLLDNAVKYLLTGTQFAPSLQISAFSAASVAGAIDNTVGASTISVFVPMGTDRSAITPVITLEGVGTTVTPSGAQNFTTGSINYTVTDGINSKVYAVSVLEQGTGLHNTLTGITFDGQTIQNNNHQMITVFDATGRLVVTSDKDVNMNGYAKGIYMIRGEKGQLKIAYTK